MINILGISGSPVKGSNTKLMLREALKAVEQDGVKIDIYDIQGKRIEDCRHCNWPGSSKRARPMSKGQVC